MATKKETAATTKRKTTAASTAKKTQAKPKAVTPAVPRAPRKTNKFIRNVRGMTVHARLYSQNPKDPFRIALAPRGQHGDSTMVPAALTDDPTFIQGVNVLFEIITESEFKNQSYGTNGPIGYLAREAPTILRPEDTTVATAPDWDGKGRKPQDREFGTGMHTADIPGSDTALHAQLKAAQQAGESALPAGVDFSGRVQIERARG